MAAALSRGTEIYVKATNERGRIRWTDFATVGVTLEGRPETEILVFKRAEVYPVAGEF